MIDSIVKAASGLKEKVGSKSEVSKILNEATNNDNWNISNSKLQVLADHTYEWNDYNTIMKHLWSKLTLKPKEWRKIFKALHALDYLLKNGAPRIIQDIKDDLYKIRSLQDMDYCQEGKDKCSGIREKAKQICELIADQERLDEERDFARKNRDKFSGYISSGITNAPGSVPSGGSKYQGFGSQDLAKYSGGYNLDSTKNRAGYDPYQKNKGPSIFDAKKKDQDGKKEKEKEKEKKKEKKEKKEKKKKDKKKKKKSESESSDSSSDSDESESSDTSSDQESSDDEKGKKDKKTKKGISKPKESEVKKEIKAEKDVKKEVRFADQQKKKEDILDLLDVGDSGSQQLANNTQNNQNIDVFGIDYKQFSANQSNANNQNNPIFNNQTNAPTGQSNMFANMNTSTNNQPFGSQVQANNISWMMTGSSTQPQPTPSISNVTNTINLFGNMNITQPVNQSSGSSQTTASFSLFDGINYPSSTQSAPKVAEQPKRPEKKADLFDDFGEFQESISHRPSEPLKQDSWSMGRHLFDLSNIK